MTAVAAPGRRSELASRALTVIAALALIGALGASYVRRAAVDSSQFADRATAALQAPPVRTLVAEKITDDLLIRHAGPLLAARPLIQGVVSGAIGGRAFADLFRAGVRDVHRAVLARDQHTITLTLADAGTVAAAGLDAVRPSLARRLRATGRVELLRDHLGGVSVAALRLTDRVRLLAILFGLVALLAGAAALALARDRRRAVARLGVAAAVAGLLLVVAWTLGRTIAAGQVSGTAARAAVDAVWGAFLGGLRAEAWLLTGIGAVIAAAASSVLRPVSLDGPLRAAWGRLSAEPSRPWARALRAIALVALGVACVLDHGLVVTVLGDALGAYLLYVGAGSLLELVNGPLPLSERAALARLPARRAATATVAAAVLAAAAIATFLGTGGLAAAGPAPAPCDGARALCARSLPEVALVATHNAMSAPLPGWYSAEQEGAIPAQLQAGVRGLLIDTHYATRLPDGKLRTDLSGERAGKLGEGISPQARRAALRLRARLGFSGAGTRGLYLCHGFCELGGTPLSAALAQIDDFLVAHPEQVIVIINEDYVRPVDFVRAVDASGLGALAYRGPTRGRWPTLAQMIASDQRVVFLAEHHAGAAPWYHLAYRSITEETPYAFSRPAQLTDPARLAASCVAHRGPRRGAPLFLVNNWVSSDPVPLAANAARVNAPAPLLRRLRTCERARHHIPNLVAVNFYREGNVFAAVAALNGLG